MYQEEGGRDLISIEDYVELVIRNSKVYIRSNDERLVQAARGNKIYGVEATGILNTKTKLESLQNNDVVFFTRGVFKAD